MKLSLILCLHQKIHNPNKYLRLLKHLLLRSLRKLLLAIWKFKMGIKFKKINSQNVHLDFLDKIHKNYCFFQIINKSIKTILKIDNLYLPDQLFLKLRYRYQRHYPAVSKYYRLYLNFQVFLEENHCMRVRDNLRLKKAIKIPITNY